MTAEIALVLGILAVSLVLFITEWLRMDIVALLVLAALSLTRLVTPTQALAGFSNPAVITVWAMFMLSAGLTRTGVADVIGRQVLRLAGRGEARMVLVIMLTAGVLSAFMNNIGVAALMLPVVMDVARRTGTAPSRLLMPLAFGSLLGGLTTLIGTPPNLLISEALREHDDRLAFSLFDFSPIGSVVLIGGTLFVTLIGRHWLPARKSGEEDSEKLDLRSQYGLHERTIVMRVRPDSTLVGRTLRESHLGSAAGLNVFTVIRRGKTRVANPDLELQAGDRLVVSGLLDRFTELRGWRDLVIEKEDFGLDALITDEIRLGEVSVAHGSELIGRNLEQVEFRSRFGVIVLAMRHDGEIHLTDLVSQLLGEGDRLLVFGPRERLDALRAAPEFDAVRDEGRNSDLALAYELEGRIFSVRIPEDSVLAGESLIESRIGDALGIGVMGLERGGQKRLMPDPQERLESGDRLLIRGRREILEALRGLQQLEIETERPGDLQDLESEQVGLIEATLSPRTALVGRTPREIHLRERFGVQVLAIQRQGRPYRSNLRDMKLAFGDSLLLSGPRDRLMLLQQEDDFLLLTQAGQAAPNTRLAPAASLIMAGVLIPVFMGWLPIALSAVIGATVMVLVRCLSMEEAYRSVEWRSIFLIAGMLPLGAAMQQTGAASFLADRVLQVAGPLGPWGVIAGLYLVTACATMIIPTAALVVLMAPIAIKASGDLGISVQTAMMAIAMAASASFTSPISHPANILVMGPGGYRFADYLKLGVPLTLLIMVVVMLTLPVFWPI